MQSGKIGVTTENIFPIIKKFLYSDHEIFLRELVSNAVDATQKLKTLSSMGKFSGELGELMIRVSLDKDNKTLTISDSGIGMTAEEVDKYINQIAFSGAEEFMQKYKNQAIIGHFGLGFYSAFMVADKVEVRTRSYQEGSKTVLWTCDGSPEYTLTELDEERERGTDIILHISEDSLEFNDDNCILELLRKYCRFLPVPIAFGQEQEWKDGKYVDTGKDRIINDTNPLWVRKPSEITDEDYLKFYRELYPASEDPLFYIHLNIDYPFNLTGILYFPKIRNNFEIQRNKIQLYSNQVFVTDSVEGIVPEFLTLLHGVIDSPDIPLNVSRSYLQSDSNVKKISGYITRKVADRLTDIFKNSREEYEKKWDDLKIFVEYGIVSDEKFSEKADGIFLFKNVDGKYFTTDEYSELTRANQTDKAGVLVYLYANNATEQHSFIRAAQNKGYDVLLLDGQLDNYYINRFEQKNAKTRFVRVDSDVVDKLIQKESNRSMMLSSKQQDILRPVFASGIKSDDKTHYEVIFEPLEAGDEPVLITRNEYMRRMKDMAAMGGGDAMSSFYAMMPENYTVVVNGNHPLVIDILGDVEREYGNELTQAEQEIDKVSSEQKSLDELLKGKKEEEISTEEKDKKEELGNKIESLRNERNGHLRELGEKNPVVKQLIDLALLSNGMLKGADLTSFIKRSVDLIGK